MSINEIRKKTRKLIIGAITVSACHMTTSCEKYDFGEEKNGTIAQTDTTSVPVRTGKGTRQQPYTIRQILAYEIPIDNAVWIIGYIIGSAHTTLSQTDFSTPTSNKTNILLAQDTTCIETNKCVPVKLPESQYNNLSLCYAPSLLHKCIMIEGQLGTYFRQKGIVKVTSYLLLPNIDINAIDCYPEIWNDKKVEF